MQSFEHQTGKSSQASADFKQELQECANQWLILDRIATGPWTCEGCQRIGFSWHGPAVLADACSICSGSRFFRLRRELPVLNAMHSATRRKFPWKWRGVRCFLHCSAGAQELETYHQVNHGKSKWLYILILGVEEFFTCFGSGEAFSNVHIDIRPQCWSELWLPEILVITIRLPWDQV